jgi:hypothetical protein
LLGVMVDVPTSPVKQLPRQRLSRSSATWMRLFNYSKSFLSRPLVRTTRQKSAQESL